MRTGSYLFRFQGENIDIKGEVLLEYDSTTSSSAQTSMNELNVNRKETWSSEQIRDFVRKLGFIDKDRDSGQQKLIAQFLHTNEVKESRVLITLLFIYLSCVVCLLCL